MQNLQSPGAITAPFASTEALQRRRISDKIGVSPALASTMASLAFGPDRREDLVALASLTAARTTSCSEGRLHG